MSVAEYELTTEDLAAFHLFFNESTEAGRSALRSYRRSETLLAVIVTPLVIGIAFHNLVGAGIFAAVAGIITWFLTPPIRSLWVKHMVKRMARTTGLGPTGHYALTVNDEGIREHSASSDTMVPWSAVLSVDETPEHAFIFIAPNQAFVVPKRGDPVALSAALDEVRSRLAESVQ
jgi:hypothetical protein